MKPLLFVCLPILAFSAPQSNIGIQPSPGDPSLSAGTPVLSQEVGPQPPPGQQDVRQPLPQAPSGSTGQFNPPVAPDVSRPLLPGLSLAGQQDGRKPFPGAPFPSQQDGRPPLPGSSIAGQQDVRQPLSGAPAAGQPRRPGGAPGQLGVQPIGRPGPALLASQRVSGPPSGDLASRPGFQPGPRPGAPGALAPRRGAPPGGVFDRRVAPEDSDVPAPLQETEDVLLVTGRQEPTSSAAEEQQQELATTTVRTDDEQLTVPSSLEDLVEFTLKELEGRFGSRLCPRRVLEATRGEEKSNTVELSITLGPHEANKADKNCQPFLVQKSCKVQVLSEPWRAVPEYRKILWNKTSCKDE